MLVDCYDSDAAASSANPNSALVGVRFQPSLLPFRMLESLPGFSLYLFLCSRPLIVGFNSHQTQLFQFSPLCNSPHSRPLVSFRYLLTALV